MHDQLTNVVQIDSSSPAVAAFLGDGSVVTWGNAVQMISSCDGFATVL